MKTTEQIGPLRHTGRIALAVLRGEIGRRRAKKAQTAYLHWVDGLPAADRKR